jgi:branched-chain amino acid transport system permease protein
MYEVLTLTAIYAVVALGLNLISGYAGMFSVSQAALFGVGAFSYAGADRLLHTDSLLVAWGVAIVAGVVVSAAVGLVSLRVAGDFFIVASFGLQLVLIQVLYNWNTVSGGASGAYGLPLPTLLGWKIQAAQDFLVLALALALVAYPVAGWLVRSPYGQLLRAMRDDETALAAGGFGSGRLRLAIFVTGGVLAALAGVVYAAYQGVAQTSDFGVSVSIMLLAVVIVGGSGNLLGSALGALLFVGAPRLLNLLSVSESVAGALQQLVFGILVVLVMATLRGGMAQMLLGPLGRIRRHLQSRSLRPTHRDVAR